MSDINPADAVSFVCTHQDTVVAILSWAMGIVPVASAVAWFNAKYDKLPPWASSLVQVLAMNFLHAAKGEPTKDTTPHE